MMNLIPGKGRLWTAATILVTALMLFAAACGGNEEDPPQCTFGVAQDGKCVNSDRCLFQADCLPGYSCSQGTCSPDQECSADADCDAGVCGSAGVCVNPGTCSTNDDCVSKTFCTDAGTCEADPCSAISCNRGACVPGSGECTSKDSCTQANELFDCVQGERCLNESCLEEDAFCEELSCERGVCSFVDGACVAADDCGGDDTQCLEGQFCNEDNECEQDRCVAEEVTCDDGGICEPSVGECQNADVCESNADCLSDHWCLEGTCSLQSMACGNGNGDGGCFGTQTCEYDDTNLTASCAEPDTCTSSLDCNDGNQCGGTECVTAATCQPDLYEPNDSESAATDFIAAAGNQSLQGDLCASDTDYYLFDSNSLEPFVVRGVLTIDLQYAARDRGLGELELELLKEQTDGSFSSVATASAGTIGQNGEITISENLGAADQGTFLMVVRGVGDISTAGVTYDLSVDLLDDPAIAACENPRVISDGDVLTSDLRQASSSLYRGSCVAADSTRAEQLFTFEVTEPSLVSAVVTPETTEDNAAVSIRSTCETLASEQACSDETSEDTEEIRDLLLSPGNYFILVEPSPAGSLARYDLSLSINPTTCAPSSNSCSDSGTSEYCVGGGSLQTVSCSNGCDPTFGLCFPVDGDVCETTTLIDTDTTETIAWGELRDDYRAPSCVPSANGSTQSDGGDKAFQVEVPAGFAVTATLTTGTDERASVYIAESCSDLEGTCLTGANADPDDGIEVASYGNRGTDPTTVFVIADSSAGQVLADSQLDIAFTEIICDPNGPTASRCAPSGPGQVQVCNEAGTGYVDDEACAPWSCETGSCLTPNTCASVVDVTADANAPGGAVISDTWGNYTNDIEGSGCGISSSYTDGHEFTVSVDLQAGEAVIANLLTDGISADPTLHIQSSCGALDAATCYEASRGSDAPTQVVYTATSAETVFITAETDDDNSSTASETFDFDVKITSTCDPATFSRSCDQGGVDYCLQRGVVANFQCSGGACTNAKCDVANADWCFDAENITAAATSSTGFARTMDWTQYTNNFLADAACDSTFTGSEIGGNDAYFRVDLLAGEVLTASLDNGSSFDDPALAVLSADNCVSGDAGQACLAAAESSSIARVSYTATANETVYLVADNDNASTTDTFDLTAAIRQSCDTSTFAPSCQGNGVVYCAAGGFQEVYDCGTSGCSAAECVTSASDFCFDSRDLTTAAAQPGGTTESVDFTQYTNDLNVDGACGFDDFEIDGNDAYFRVDLQANEILLASLDPGSSSDDPAIALVSGSDCALANSGTSTCLDSDEQFTGSANVRYTATTAETIYVIADVDEPASTAIMDLNLEIREACDPATFSTVCRTDTVAYCDPGGFVGEYDCGAGNCSSGTCTTTTSDFCFDAQDLTVASGNAGGTTVSVDYANKTPFIEIDACGLTPTSTSGPEGVYRVDMTAGEILTANLDQGTSGAGPSVAIVGECTDAGGSCFAGDDGGSAPAEATYFASTDTTVYVIADTDQLNVSNPFSLTVTREPSPCSTTVTGAASCAPNGDGVQTCDQSGNVVETTCTACCTTAAGGSSQPALSIPDSTPSGVSDTISISGCTTVTDVLVGVEIPHTWKGDLSVDLTSPSGDTVLLHDRSGGSASDVIGFYPTTLTPAGSLSTFNSTAGDGDWTLSVSDNVGGDTGTLNSWTLALACQ